MEETSSISLPANYVTLKDLQERWLKRKQDEEDEAKLRRLQEEEEIKARHEKEARNHQLKSENPDASASHSQGREKGGGAEWKKTNPANGFIGNKGKAIVAPASHYQVREEGGGAERKKTNPANGFVGNKGKAKKAIVAPASHYKVREEGGGAERKKTNPANGFSGKKGKATDAKPETSAAIVSRGKSKKRGSARGRVPPSESESVAESARGDRVEEICRPVADLSIDGGGSRRGGRVSRGGGCRRRRGGGAVRVSATGAGMVWVRKTTEG